MARERTCSFFCLEDICPARKAASAVGADASTNEYVGDDASDSEATQAYTDDEDDEVISDSVDLSGPQCCRSLASCMTGTIKHEGVKMELGEVKQEKVKVKQETVTHLQSQVREEVSSTMPDSPRIQRRLELGEIKQENATHLRSEPAEEDPPTLPDSPRIQRRLVFTSDDEDSSFPPEPDSDDETLHAFRNRISAFVADI